MKTALEECITFVRERYPNGHSDFLPLTLQNIELHSTKNADYSHGGDPLGNFNRVSDMLKQMGCNLSPAQVAFVYMMKQLDASGQMLFQNYEGKVEGIDSRLQDVVVYGNLIRILKREEHIEKDLCSRPTV